MKKILNKGLALISSIILLLLCAYAIHDMQTAEGVGYYFCLKLNAQSRLPFDILTDVIFMILLMVLLLIPIISDKRKSIYSFSAFLLVFVTFIPSISADYFFNFFKPGELFTPYLKADILAIDFISSFRLLIPLIVLLAGINWIVKDKKPEKKDWLLMMISFILIIVTIPFPGLYDLTFFVSSYLFIIVLFRQMKEIGNKLWILHILLFFTSAYNIYNVCQSFSL